MQNITRRADCVALCSAAAPPVAHRSRDAWMARESINDLAVYYDACWAAEAGLIAHYNQPRCDHDGVVGSKIEDMAEEFMERIQAVAEHVATRVPANSDEAHDRHRLLLHWHSKIGDDTGVVALAREIIALNGGEA